MDQHAGNIHECADSPSDKLAHIKDFIEMYMQSSKRRGKMYGNISEIECQWHVLDFIYCILENVPNDKISLISWGAFLITKGYSANKELCIVFAEKKLKDPYSALVKLRNEYEEWRKNKIAELREGLKNETINQLGA
jgi:hypothetical protein